jgi:hypothetical protein
MMFEGRWPGGRTVEAVVFFCETGSVNLVRRPSKRQVATRVALTADKQVLRLARRARCSMAIECMPAGNALTRAGRRARRRGKKELVGGGAMLVNLHNIWDAPLTNPPPTQTRHIKQLSSFELQKGRTFTSAEQKVIRLNIKLTLT